MDSLYSTDAPPLRSTIIKQILTVYWLCRGRPVLCTVQCRTDPSGGAVNLTSPPTCTAGSRCGPRLTQNLKHKPG